MRTSPHGGLGVPAITERPYGWSSKTSIGKHPQRGGDAYQAMRRAILKVLPVRATMGGRRMKIRVTVKQVPPNEQTFLMDM